MDSVMHFAWYDGTATRGRVAVRITGDGYIQLVRLSGPLPPAQMAEWDAALHEAFPGLDARMLDDARRIVTRPWRVERRYGMSGCITFKLRELVSRELLDQPVRASLHVTMANKLEEFEMRLGHFYFLLGDMLAEQRQESEPGFRVRAAPPREIVDEDWSPPPAEQHEQIDHLLAQMNEE